MELCPGGTWPVWNHFYLGFKLQRGSLTLSMLKVTFYDCWYNLQTVQTKIRTNRKLVLNWIHKCLMYTLSVSQNLFENINFGEKRSDDNKIMQNYQACREKLLNRLFKPAQEKSVVRWTDRPAMTIAVDLGRKATKPTNQPKIVFYFKLCTPFCLAEVSYLSQSGWWHSWENWCEIFESGQWLKRCCSKNFVFSFGSPFLQGRTF